MLNVIKYYLFTNQYDLNFIKSLHLSFHKKLIIFVYVFYFQNIDSSIFMHYLFKCLRICICWRLVFLWSKYFSKWGLGRSHNEWKEWSFKNSFSKSISKDTVENCIQEDYNLYEKTWSSLANNAVITGIANLRKDIVEFDGQRNCKVIFDTEVIVIQDNEIKEFK